MKTRITTNIKSAIVATLSFAVAIALRAETITVTNTNDSGAGSLRQALADTNDGDAINFAVTGTITLTSGELVIAKNITIAGPGADVLGIARDSSAAPFRIFRLTADHTVTIEGLTITNGQIQGTGQSGGGIANDHSMLTVNNCVINGNSAASGGGIFSNGGNSGSARLTITNSTLNANSAGVGGGIFSNGGTSGSATLTIANSTLSENSASQGGGIFNEGDNKGSGTVTINNSTLAGNTAVTNGGALLSDGFVGTATAMIVNSTLSGNTAGNSGIAGTVFNGGTSLHIGNCILKSAQGPNLGVIGGSTITSDGYNLSSDDGRGFLNGPGDQINTDPMLGPLQDNGGPTLTHELLSASPAIDAGDPKFFPPPFYDQRGPGFERVVNGRVDIGSFEVQGPIPTPSPTPPPSATPTPRPTPTPRLRPTPRSRPTPRGDLARNAITSHERLRSRGSVSTAELSRCVANGVGGFFADHLLANRARAATGDFAVRVGLSSRHGLEPDRGLGRNMTSSALLVRFC